MRYLFFNTNRKEGRFKPTWDFVEATQDEFNWERIDTHLEDPYGYSKEIQKVWNKGDDLLFLEEDKVPSRDIIRKIVECDSPICSQLYPYHIYDLNRRKWLRPFVGGVYTDFINHLGYPDRRPLHDGEVWGTYLDLGLFKVSREAQKYDLAKNIKFGGDNFVVGEAFVKAGVKIHAHRPAIQHNHIKISYNFIEDYTIPDPPEEYLEDEIRSVMQKSKPVLDPV